MGSPFPAYTVADFMKEIVVPYQARTGGYGDIFCTLPISKYVSLCDYAWSGTAITCDSHKLVTVGHDEYCAYVTWKRGRSK